MRRELGIGDVPVDVRLGDLDRLDQRVQRLAADPAPNDRRSMALDQVRLHQHLEAAARRRRIAVDVVAAIGRVQRLGPLRLVGRQVGRVSNAAVLLEEALELLRDVALVEPIERGPDGRRSRRASAPCACLLGVDQLAQRRRVVGILQQLAGLERLARPAGRSSRSSDTSRGCSCPRAIDLREHRIDRIALLGVARSPARTPRRCVMVPKRSSSSQIAAQVARHDAGLHAGVQHLAASSPPGISAFGARAGHRQREHLAALRCRTRS